MLYRLYIIPPCPCMPIPMPMHAFPHAHAGITCQAIAVRTSLGCNDDQRLPQSPTVSAID